MMWWPTGRAKQQSPADRWNLNSPLLWFSKDDPFTLADAFEGCLVTGASGSGKSTGSGCALAYAYLFRGAGGIVLTSKKDERYVWEQYCRETGRLDDLRVFSADGKYRYNFLDWELKKGGGAGLTSNIVNLFSQVVQIAERGGASGGGGREDEGYWRRANLQLIRNSVDLLVFATGRLSVPDLYRIVVSAPTSLDLLDSKLWQEKSFCFRCIKEADSRPRTARQQADFRIVADYFMLEFPSLSEKTRSVIVSTFTSMIDVIHRGVLADLFCTDTNLTPEAVEDGAIIVIDLPVKEFAEVGQFAQVLWKTAFQRSIERRDLANNRRPVFLWADEAQHFVTSPHDMQFQTTCRAAHVATVYLTQNISNFYAAMGGGERAKVEVDSLFANLNTKIFHANTDPVTNEWAASIVGKSRQWLSNASTNYQASDWLSGVFGVGRTPQTSSGGVNEVIDFELPPSRFVTLRKGGAVNGWRVDAIVVQGGRRFRYSGRTWMPVTFNQRG
jgi:TraM recognition site of TraD and TraG